MSSGVSAEVGPGPKPPNRRNLLFAALFLASVIAAAAVGVIVGRVLSSLEDKDDLAMRSTPSVVVAVRDLARLEGAEYRIERVIELTETQKTFFGLVEAEDAILLVASGDVIAGVELANLGDGAFQVDKERRAVKITLPHSTIFFGRLDNKRSYVYRRDTDLLAERGDGLETRARQEAEKTLVEAAKEGGILKRSDESVRRTVESLARSLGYAEVTVTFR